MASTIFTSRIRKANVWTKSKFWYDHSIYFIDLTDLKPFVQYEGGYSELSPTIRHLWEVLKDFNSQDKALFLKFVTSCSRPPVGGFKCRIYILSLIDLSPPFTIRLQSDDRPGFWRSVQVLSGLKRDVKRLPSRYTLLPNFSSTCFNTLKLPAYISKRALKEKLTYAIRSNAGFDLS